MTTIAIEALGTAQPGGGRSATLTVLRELLRRDAARRYVLLLDQFEPELAACGDHVTQRLSPPGLGRFTCRLWAQADWPISLRREGVQLVHHRNLTASLLPGRRVVTIYDLGPVLDPAIFPLADRLYWQHIQPRALRRADAVIAISQRTANDLMHYYHLPPEQIEVIHLAYHPRFAPQPESESTRARARYAAGSPYILHVGWITMRKNLGVLLAAFERLCARGYDGRLVLVGRRYAFGDDDAFERALAASPYRERVALAGMAPDEDLPALYSGADLVIFPSLYEGFGIVPVEAMACGAPLIASSAGALPEVVGEGGVLVADPTDAAAFAAEAERLLSDPAARAALGARGLAWSRRYSASEAAEKTLAVYERVLSAS